MRESSDSCIECDRLLDDYIVALRALGAVPENSRRAPDGAFLEAHHHVQETLRPLVRHQYTHQGLVTAINSPPEAARLSSRAMHG
jgi:hypothetical protein